MVAGCSGDDTATDRDKGSSSSQSADGTSGDGSSVGTGDSSSGDAGAASAKEEQKRLEAARAASKKPSGVEGEPAPNDDDGARNLAAVDPATGPAAQDTSGSIGRDPLDTPTPTFPEPGRPDVEGLPSLEGCADIATPFYRAVTTLNVNATSETIADGVADLSIVAAKAQAPIAAAAQLLLTTAQSAAADAARAQDFAGEPYQAAVKTVHVYLGDACGR